MPNKIYLCGTIHLDLAGPERLRKVLEINKPDCMAIESDPSLSREVLERRKELVNLDEEAAMCCVA